MSEQPIPDDWDGISFCRWAVCWPDSPKWKAVLYGLVEMPIRGRFWDFSTGHFLSLRESFREAYDYNFDLKEVIMACQDTGIADGLQAIASALAQMAVNSAATNNNLIQLQQQQNLCCETTIINQGGGVVGNTTQTSGENVPIYGTQPPLSLEPGTFPEGYEDLEDYKLNKCQVANLIIDGWKQSLYNLGAIGTFNGIALAGLVVAAIVGAIVFPPAAIVLMCAAIGVMTVEVTLCVVVADEIENHRQELLCILYNSDAVEVIIPLIADILDTIIAALSTSTPIGIALKTVALLLINSDTLNALFEKRAHAVYPDADCSSCECDIWVQSGSPDKILQETDTFIEIQSTENAPDWHFVLITFNVVEIGVPCGPMVTIENTGLVGWTARGSNDYQLQNDEGLFYISSTIWTHPQPDIRSFLIHSSTPFTLTMTISHQEE